MAATSEFSNRIDVLARPKPVPTGFRDSRRSLYWVDYVPSAASEGGTTCAKSPDQTDNRDTAFTHRNIVHCYFNSQAVASARVKELSRSKNLNANYKGDRPTPVWLVSPAAQTATPSARTDSLSQPKSVNPSYQPLRSPYMAVTPAAKNGKSTDRLDTLAVPRQKSDMGTVRDPADLQTVSPAAMKATASGRVEQLAEFKKSHPQFQGEKPIQWEVTDSAMKAIASLRLQQLSRPRSRSLLKDDYDPYKVTFAARHAHPTPRVEELSVPLPRKVVTKKM